MLRLIAIILLLPSILSSNTFRGSSDDKRFPVRIEGHRGVGHLEPENSLKAFKRAIELGIDGIELDVWITEDKIPVVAHGKPGGVLEFDNDAEGKIQGMNSSDLLNHTLKNGEKVLKLEEVLDFCKDKINLNIEIKDKREFAVGLVLDLLQEKSMLQQITLSSFDHKHRTNLRREMIERKIHSDIAFGHLMNNMEPTFPDYQNTKPGDAIVVDIRYFKEQREKCLAEIKKAQENQVKVKFWFPIFYQREHIYYDDLLKLDIDTIITNKPLTLMEYLRNNTKNS